MNMYTILDLLKKGLSKSQICKEMQIEETKFDLVIERAFHLLQVEEKSQEPEFNEKTHTLSKTGFENNVDFLCAQIESGHEFSEEEVVDLAEQGIETNYDLIKANHPMQERLAGHFTVAVCFPIILLPDQEASLQEKLKKQ